ncbi:hypothetical protein ACODT4_44220 [Streptomyces sp. 2.9]|uniref:hypothetical protein n=1 Tax=Streptomyces tritrimontium TaxID=3406573 RepID=UPI003BB72E8F
MPAGPEALVGEAVEPPAADGGEAATEKTETSVAADAPAPPTADAKQPDALPAEEPAASADEEHDLADVGTGTQGEPVPPVSEVTEVAEVAAPRAEPPLAAPAVPDPPQEPPAPLWGTKELPVSAYAGGPEGNEERSEAAAAVDLVANFQQFRAAWDAVVTDGGTSDELLDEVRPALATLQSFINEPVDSAPAPGPAVPPARQESQGERDGQQEAAAVTEALRQADTHEASLRDLPEWQKIQTVRGAMGHLFTVIAKRAGEHIDQLLGDERATTFLREVSARVCDKVADLAQTAARKLRGDDARRGELPSAEALLRLGDAATAYSTPRRGRGGTPPADAETVLPAMQKLEKMGEALAKPMPGRGKVSASAARSRSATAKRPTKKPAPGSTEQAPHLRRGGPDQPPPRKPTR